MGRPNLDVQTRRLVTRVLFEDRRALGVEVVDAVGTGSASSARR